MTVSYEALAATHKALPDAHAETKDFLLDIAPLAGGFVGMTSWPEHRVLGTLMGLAVGRNAADYIKGESTALDVAESLAAHTVATVGSLSTKEHPVLGYISGAAVSGLLFTHLRDTPDKNKVFKDTLVGNVLGKLPGQAWPTQGQILLEGAQDAQVVDSEIVDLSASNQDAQPAMRLVPTPDEIEVLGSSDFVVDTSSSWSSTISTLAALLGEGMLGYGVYSAAKEVHFAGL